MHLMKCNKGSGTRIIAHATRSRETRTESQIDYTKTHLNYSLMPTRLDHYENRCKELVKRKDAVTLCGVVLTLPEELRYKGVAIQKKFFKDALEGIQEHWGGEGIYAEVHMDETTPHLHYGFMPIRDGKLQAKNIVTRQALKEFHSKVEEHLKVKGWKDIHLQEQDEEQREKNHALGIGTKTLRDYKKDAIEQNSKMVEDQITQVQQSFYRSAKKVKKRKDETKEEYKKRKSEYIEVRKDEYDMLRQFKSDLSVQELYARETLRKQEQENAIIRLNESEKAYSNAKHKIDNDKAEIEAKYEQRIALLNAEYKKELKRVKEDAKEEVYVEMTTNIFSEIDHSTEEKEQEACEITCHIIGEENVRGIVGKLVYNIRRAFQDYFGRDRDRDRGLYR